MGAKTLRNHDTGIFKVKEVKENMKLKQEACQPDSSVFRIDFSGHKKKLPKVSSNIAPNHSSGL